MKKDWSNHKLIAFLPLLCVLIAYATEAATRYSFFECKTNNCTESIPANLWKVFNVNPEAGKPTLAGATESNEERLVTALRYSGRINWFFLSDIFLYACIGSIAIACILSYQIVPSRRGDWALGVLAFALMIGLGFHANPHIHMAMFLTLFEHAITVDVPTISDVVNSLNSLGNAALFSLLLAIYLTLLPEQSDVLPAASKGISLRIKHMNIILYAGAFLLITGVLLKSAVYQWSLAYTMQDKSLEIAKDFVSNLLTWEGGFYTLVLAAAYLPAMLVLQRRARLLIDPSVGETEKETKLKEMGMTFNLKESLPRILAILGPLLTGPVGDLLKAKFL